MRISDLVTVKSAGTPVSLAHLRELRDMLDQEGESLSLLSGVAVQEVLQDYVTPADAGADPLYQFLQSLSANGGRGAGYLLRGPHKAGKSHLLTVAALLLEYPRLRPIFGASHPAYQRLLTGLSQFDPLIAVPVPLEEHRAHDEHLEDIVFDRTEAELRRPRYGLELPLSEHSYALDLIERHVAPRYGPELDAHVSRLPGTQRTWQELAERNPAAAVAAGRAFAQEIGYPLDFRQSRVERLARLLDILGSRHYKAIVWLMDDLGQFLAASGQKAVRNDAAFLEFLGQRSKIAPLYLVGAMNMALDQTAGIEPFMLAGIQDTYTTLPLGTADLRQVSRQRALQVNDPTKLAEALEEVGRFYERAFGQRSFTREELQNSYPLHPLAASCLEAIYGRFLAEADALADFLQTLATAGRRPVCLEDDYRQLLSLGDILTHLTARLSAHPQVAAYLREAVDYYERSGAALCPATPDLPARLARQLVVLRLGNMAVPVSRLAEDLGCTPEGPPRFTEAQVRETLEAMRLRGRFVDVRRGATTAGDSYLIDVEANFTELARRHLLAFKASLTDDDPRLWEAATAVLNATALPLDDLTDPVALQVDWLYTRRTVAVQALPLTSLTVEKLAGRCADLADPGAAADIVLYVAELGRLTEQRAAWREACAGLPRDRWAAGVVAWLPRALTTEELDRVRELAACRALLQEAAPRQDAKLNDRLAEEATRLAAEVRLLVVAAYFEGEMACGEGHLLSPEDLARTRGDWPATLETLAAAALARVYPKLAAAPPRQCPTAPHLKALVHQILTAPGGAWYHEGLLGDLTGAFLEPLKLVVRQGDRWRLDPSACEVAEELLTRLRRRDQTPETEPGRSLAYSDLSRSLARSAWGLTPELLQLVVTVLIRKGLLLPLDSQRQLVPWGELQSPLAEKVALVCRAPLLGTSSWQDLTRLSRILLERTVPRPDHALQAEIWEALATAREAQLAELARLRKVLAVLQERLGQSAAVWPETIDSLDHLQRVLEAIDPQAYPAYGLQDVLAVVEPLLSGTPSTLSLMLRQKQVLALFLERTAPDVVGVIDYLNADNLVLPADSDLVQRRQQLLEVVAAGERLLSEETTFRRLVQIFLAVYKRRYSAWHSRCYRLAVFDKYRTLRTAPEFRVLAAFQRLELRGVDKGSRALELLAAQESRRCTFAGLNEALDHSPACPQCGLRLDQELDLVSLDDVRAAAEQEVAAYVAILQRPGFQRALREYSLGLPGRGELVVKLEQLLNLADHTPARTLLAILTDDVLAHLNRVLSGKTIRPRNFAELRTALAGRTVSKEEAQQLFLRWLEGEEGPGGPEGDEILHIEP